MKGKKILTGLLCAAVVGNLVAGVAPGMMCGVSAASAQTSTEQKKVVQTTKKLEQKRYNGVPGYQYKDIYATDRVTVKGIKVNEVVIASANPIVMRPMTKPVKFVIYNTTKQETEGEVTVENGKLPDLSLVNNNNYMIYAQDEEYRTPILYIWVKEGKIYNIKKNIQDNDGQMIYDYPEVDEFRMYKRDPNKVYDKLENDMRVGISLPVYYKNGTGLLKNVKLKLVSPVETLECTTGENGRLQTELLEDQNYMVVIENEQWDMDSFPLVAKDKSEYGAGRYAYNHSSCAKVDELRLVDKNETHHSDTILVSKSGDTSVTGINFKDMLLYEKSLSKDLVSELPNKDYEVLDISVVNPHRWERAKLAAGEFQVTRKVPEGKTVKNVYYLDGEKQLKKLAFENQKTKNGTDVQFTMHSLGMYPVVVEYGKASDLQTIKASKVQVTGASRDIAAGKKIQLKAKVSPAKATDKKVKWTTSNKKYATVTSAGKVTVNKAGAGKKVTIKATAVDGSKKSGSYTIRIRKHAVKKITLKASDTLKNGKAITVKATVKTTGKDVNKQLAWNSSNSKYATVTAKGKVTAKKAGKGKTVKITAKATDGSGIKKTIKIKIK